MANPQSTPSGAGGHAAHSSDDRTSSSGNIHIIKPVPWPRTKKTFYIWWTLLLILPFLLSIGSVIGFIVSLFHGDKEPDRHGAPDDRLPAPVILLLAILQFLAYLTLLYYLSVKIRALYAKVSAAHQVAAASSSGPASNPRWLIGFERRFDSALEMEEWFVDGGNLKGAGILLGLSTVWFVAVGAAATSMFVLLMFVGKGIVGLIVLVGVFVGGLSLLGHLGYVWARSVKVLVLGGCIRGRRPRGDVEEGGDEDGERLLPLDAATAQEER